RLPSVDGTVGRFIRAAMAEQVPQEQPHHEQRQKDGELSGGGHRGTEARDADGAGSALGRAPNGTAPATANDRQMCKSARKRNSRRIYGIAACRGGFSSVLFMSKMYGAS